MQAVAGAGPVRIAISTGGVSPRVGGSLKAGLQRALDATFARFLACLAHQRRLNRARHAGDPAARRTTMLAAAEGFEIRGADPLSGVVRRRVGRAAPARPRRERRALMASVEIVTIGTEILLGQLVDTNSAQIAELAVWPTMGWTSTPNTPSAITPNASRGC